MRKRTQARECSLKILYQAEMTRKSVTVAIGDFFNSEETQDPEVIEFTRRLVTGVEENMGALDNTISEHATNWELKRMAIIDRNILRLGVYELLHMPDVPPKVTINEAVDLAKKYGDIDSGKFVNGVLDKIHKLKILPQSKKS